MKKHAGWRELDFYKQLMDLPNVVLIHPSVDSHELIQHCDLVLTISGDAAFEAGFYKKSAVIFSDPDYLDLSSLHCPCKANVQQFQFQQYYPFLLF